MNELEDLHKRIKSLEHLSESFIIVSARLDRLLPTVATLVEDLERVTKSPSTIANEDEANHRRKLPILLEEVRVLLEEVESGTDSLESQINAIESLQSRTL